MRYTRQIEADFCSVWIEVKRLLAIFENKIIPRKLTKNDKIGESEN